jgi:hypothetical protein
MFKFQGRDQCDDSIPPLPYDLAFARIDDTVDGKIASSTNTPAIVPYGAPNGKNEHNNVTPDIVSHHATGLFKTLPDALAKIDALEQELKLLKQKLIVAEDKSTSYQIRNLELEHQLRNLAEEIMPGKDMSRQKRGNEHARKAGQISVERSPACSTPSRKKDAPRMISSRTIPKLDASIMTVDDILFYGLCHVGFGEERQRVVNETSVNRFKAHYGPEPRTVKDLMSDLCCEFPDTTFKELLMGLNWLKLYDVESVLAGRWNFDESVCRDKCRETTRRIQSFREKIVVFDPSMFRPEEIHIISVDCVNFITQEFRLDPHTKWFDHKSHSAGLKYEFAISVWQSRCVWINGPYPAGLCHDKALFCGAKSMDDPSETWNRDSLLFQIPDGKKAIADSAYEGLPEKVTVKRPGHTANVFRFLDRAQNRQESYHCRLENYSILYHRFRHGKSTEDKMNLHKMAVDAVAVIVQYDMKYHPLFQMN